MKPTEIRAKVLSDHETLRGMLVSVDDLSKEILGGQRRLLGVLRTEGEALLEYLQNHMYWEERYLAPALRDADAWGEERVEELMRDHREQREMLSHALEVLRDPSRPSVLVARNVADLVQLLRQDMKDEEEAMLDERVLRDDVVSVDMEAG